VVNLIGNDGVKPSYWRLPRRSHAAGQNLTLALAGQMAGTISAFARFNPAPVRTDAGPGSSRPWPGYAALSGRKRPARP